MDAVRGIALRATLTSAALCLAMLSFGLASPTAQAGSGVDTSAVSGHSPSGSKIKGDLHADRADIIRSQALARDLKPTSIRLNGPSAAVPAGSEVTLTGDVRGGHQGGKKNWASSVEVRVAQRAKGEWTEIQRQWVYTGGDGIGADFSFVVLMGRNQWFMQTVTCH